MPVRNHFKAEQYSGLLQFQYQTNATEKSSLLIWFHWKLHIDPKVARHYVICQKLNAVYKAKNHDYGDSFGDTFKKLGIISAVTRLSDKMNRLMSLAVAHDAQVKDEKIEDTLLDMANYAIMTLIELGYEVDE